MNARLQSNQMMFEDVMAVLERARFLYQGPNDKQDCPVFYLIVNRYFIIYLLFIIYYLLFFYYLFFYIFLFFYFYFFGWRVREHRHVRYSRSYTESSQNF